MSKGLRITVYVLIAAIIAALFWFRREAERKGARPANAATRPTPTAPAVAPTANTNAPATEGESHLADELNAPGGTIQRDLEILNEVFATFQTNFPRTGNPVGENNEITAALTGDNSLKFAFISRRHPAINAKGELCDRWGTPFRFHQISGTQMEIRSAGPDRKFGTDDDAIWQAQQ